MANGHGGYRQPANPAPVSGPGALSQRTDGQPLRAVTGMPYGEAGAFLEQQSAAPLAQSAGPASPSPGAGPAAPPRQPPTPLSADSEFPDEPVTAGAALGAGPGMEAVAGSASNPDLEALRPYLATLELMASQPNVTPSARNFVRRLRGAMPVE
jgi:hypothetical protein